MPRTSFCYALGLLLVVFALPAAAKQVILGPPNPGAEQGWDDWNHGTANEGYQSIDSTDPATGNSDFEIGNKTPGQENHADWRSQIFPLGPAAGGRAPIMFSFSYKLLDKVNDGDNIRVQLRFYGKANNFISQKEYLFGSASHNSEMTGYTKLFIGDIHAPLRAQNADVTLSANFYDVDHWTSGTARFDDFSVTTVSKFPILKLIIAFAVLLVIAGFTVWLIRGRRA